MMGKRCTKCLIFKDYTDYAISRRDKDGRQDKCKECDKAYRLDNLYRHKQYAQKYYAANKEMLVAKALKYARANPGKYSGHKAKHHAAKLNATPAWLTEAQLKEIASIYESRPKGYHVDHIVPLQGNKVCGLHVPWNLQHLPASLNISKKNKFTG